MDPVLGSTLLKVGGSLLGGLFGKKKKAPSAYDQTIQGIKGQAEGARKYGEEFGFNPLTLLGVSQPMGQGAAPENYMGNAIADAALLAADGIAQNAAAQKLERAERLNSKLQQQVTDLTIRPKVGGIYDQRVATPTTRQALGASNGGRSGLPVHGVHAERGGVDSSVSSSDGLRPLSDTSPVDPRRETDHKKVGSTSGFMAVDNPYVDRPLYFPTIDGDEALQWYDWPTLALGYAGNWAFDRYLKPAQIGEPNSVDYVDALERDKSLKGKKPARRPNREYWTHPQTGFSAPRQRFGF